MYLENHRIRLSIRKVFFLLLFIVLILVVMHFFPGSLSRMIQNRFNLDGEANIPNWYSTVLLFFVSLTSLGIYILSDNVSHLHLRGFWLVFSGVYCFLSLDEAACLHEIIDIMTSIKWVYVYAPFAGIFF